MKNLFVLVFTLTLTIIFVFNAHAAGDAAKGKGAYAVCLACHGADGMGNKALNAPQIAGQSTWYLERQLKNFKPGIRGANSKDTYGMQMRPMAMSLKDAQSIKDLATYVASFTEEIRETPVISSEKVSEAPKTNTGIVSVKNGVVELKPDNSIPPVGYMKIESAIDPK